MTPLDPTAYDDFDESEWRRRPRRDRTGTRNQKLSIRLTENEYNAITELARECDMPVCDYIVCRVLRRKTRVSAENDLTNK